MINKYSYEYTDLFNGEANYSWVKGGHVTMPELTHYGYTGCADGSYARANKRCNVQLMKRVKEKLGLTNVKGRVYYYNDTIEFRPYRFCTILFINSVEGE